MRWLKCDKTLRTVSGAILSVRDRILRLVIVLLTIWQQLWLTTESACCVEDCLNTTRTEVRDLLLYE